jgi:rubrerythrin
METLTNFMQEKQLSTDDVSELLVVGGLAMSENPKDLEQALTKVDEFRNQLLSHLGQLLPEDLQKKVDEGLLDEGSAKEVALSRVNDQRAANKVQRAESVVETTQQQSQQSQQQVAAQGVHTAMNNWQSLKAGSDPDFKEKAPELAKEIELRVLRAGGTILDPHKAVEIAEEAYKTVSETFQRLRPAKAPEAKRMTQSKAAPTNMASKPGSAIDAARAALERANG